MKEKQQKKEKGHLLSNIWCKIRVRKFWSVTFLRYVRSKRPNCKNNFQKKMGTTRVVAEDRRGGVCKIFKLDDSIK